MRFLWFRGTDGYVAKRTMHEITLNGMKADPPAQAVDMNWFKPFHVLAIISRFALAALFLFTAGAKLWILKDFGANVGELLTASGVDSVRWTWPVTIAVIGIEIVTVVLLLLPRTVRAGAILAVALLAGFTGFALYYVYVLHGEPLECGCFGRLIGSQLGLWTALRNLALIIPAVIVFFGYRRRTESRVAGVGPVHHAQDARATITS